MSAPARRAAARVALLLALAGGMALPAAAQTVDPNGTLPPASPPAPTTSSIRTLLDQTGILVIEHLHPLPPIDLPDGAGPLGVAAAWAYEPGREEQRLLGVRMELRWPELPGPERVAYLDLHEVESLLRSMDFMEAAARTRSGIAEARFVSLEGFGVGTVVNGEEVRHWIQGGRAEPVQHALSSRGFESLRARLAQARERLFSQ